MWPFARRAKPALGKRGEKAARRFLKRKGMKILAENFRCPRGEVDLIALDRSTQAETAARTICFVEVKTRSSDRYTDPESAVDAEKRTRIKRAADYYLAGRAAAEGLNVRFDIVSIVMAGGEPQIKHIPDAF